MKEVNVCHLEFGCSFRAPNFLYFQKPVLNIFLNLFMSSKNAFDSSTFVKHSGVVFFYEFLELNFLLNRCWTPGVKTL